MRASLEDAVADQKRHSRVTVVLHRATSRIAVAIHRRTADIAELIDLRRRTRHRLACTSAMPISATRFSADGRFLIVAREDRRRRQPATESSYGPSDDSHATAADQSIEIWDASNGRLHTRLSTRGSELGIWPDPTGKSFLTTAVGLDHHRWNLPDGQLIERWTDPDQRGFPLVIFSRDGSNAIVLSEPGIRIWRTGEPAPAWKAAAYDNWAAFDATGNLAFFPSAVDYARSKLRLVEVTLGGRSVPPRATSVAPETIPPELFLPLVHERLLGDWRLRPDPQAWWRAADTQLLRIGHPLRCENEVDYSHDGKWAVCEQRSSKDFYSRGAPLVVSLAASVSPVALEEYPSTLHDSGSHWNVISAKGDVAVRSFPRDRNDSSTYLAVWNGMTGKKLWSSRFDRTVAHSALFDPTGTRVLVLKSDIDGSRQTLSVHDAQTGRLIRAFSEVRQQYGEPGIFDDSGRLYISRNSTGVSVLDLETQDLVSYGYESDLPQRTDPLLQCGGTRPS